MKKSLLFMSIILLSLLSLLTSCEGDQSGIGGYAPNKVAGKTMTIRDRDGNLEWKIVFRSNTSATLSQYSETYSFSSIKYEKTGTYSATLQIKDIDTNWYDINGPIAPITEKYSLIFTSPNEGTVKGSVYGGIGYFDLF